MRLTLNGTYLRMRRKARGWTQIQLAEAAGVGEKTVRNAESGERLNSTVAKALCHGLLAHSGSRPSADEISRLLSKLSQPLQQALKANEAPVRKAATCSAPPPCRTDLPKQQLLKTMQGYVLEQPFVLDKATYALLRDAEYQCLRTADESGRYASIILCYALLKAGPETSSLYRADFARMLYIHSGHTPERMAALWIAGRAHLSWMATTAEVIERRKEAELADKYLCGIEIVPENTLRMPVLLPGLQQEMSSNKLIQLDSAPPNEPLAREIVVPHRYIAATAVALAELNRSEQTNYLRKAEKHCQERRNECESKSTLTMNVQLLERDADAFLCSNNRLKATEKVKSITKAENLEQRIRASDQLSVAKSAEWIAHCKACLALLSTTRGDEDLVNHILRLAEILKRVPDFLTIDPVYRLALNAEQPGLFDAVMKELHAKVKKIHER